MHTSKRMHFIEDGKCKNAMYEATCLHTSKRMHFIEDTPSVDVYVSVGACIRQNVCTSLRIEVQSGRERVAPLHTSKRMHFIEDPIKKWW